MKLGQNSRMSSKLDHVWSKTRSLGKILQKRVRSRGKIFSLIVMKPCQNVCLDEISDECKKGSFWVKNKVATSDLRKTSCLL